MVGDGRLRKDLETEAIRLQVFDAVHFLGYRDDVPELLKAMDVFVLPSISEGLPRVLLEAMAAGVPCIGTKVGGILEILADGKFGFLVPPKDENTLAEVMVKMVQMSEEEKQKLIEESRRRVKDKYNHALVIKRLENIYETEYNAKQLLIKQRKRLGTSFIC